MNSLVPNFTMHLLQTVQKEKAARVSQDEKVEISTDVAKFLQTYNSYGVGKPVSSGNYLKTGRSWPTKRASNPYDISFNDKSLALKKTTTPSRKTIVPNPKKLDEEMNHQSLGSYTK